jgi:hypothetical protein
MTLVFLWCSQSRAHAIFLTCVSRNPKWSQSRTDIKHFPIYSFHNQKFLQNNFWSKIYFAVMGAFLCMSYNGTVVMIVEFWRQMHEWAWSTGGMKLTGENWCTWSNTCPSATSSTRTSHLDWPRIKPEPSRWDANNWPPGPWHSHIMGYEISTSHNIKHHTLCKHKEELLNFNYMYQPCPAKQSLGSRNINNTASCSKALMLTVSGSERTAFR